MTLHWWMHWFWVTAQIVASLTSPAAEHPTEPALVPDLTTVTSNPENSSAMLTTTPDTLARLQQSYRIAKAIGIQPTETAGLPESPSQTHGADLSRNAGTVSPVSAVDKPRATSTPDNHTDPAEATKTGQPGRKKESKITWIQAFSKPAKPSKHEEKTSTLPSAEPEPPDELLTVMPLQEQRPRSKLVDPNAIRRDQPALNRSVNEELAEEETAEPHVVATAASVLDAGVADSTRLGRARGTFTSEFQRDQLSREEQKEKPINETAESGANVTEIATITGSCLAVIVLLSTVGSLGFIMYRRRYLNPPQTLNSDKCSNPDSSGYIDDSTIRDNSEEMYSLDNDSFLNSLEAMTIQNYWTDSVKHTKL